MLYVYASALLVVNSAGLALIPFGLPGIWLMALSTVGLAWWQSDAGMIGVDAIVAVLVLAALSEVFELLSSMAGTKVAGGTRRGAWGGLVGGFGGAIFCTGLIPIPVVGTVFGACLGALIGGAAFELLGGRELKPALRSGSGAAAGRLVGTTIKLAFGVAVWVVAGVAAFWP
jgi:uncharacterized protein YqgC (DUF456 family)